MKRAKAIVRTVGEAAQISFFLVGVIFIVHLINGFLQFKLNQFGIIPRTTGGLIGILFSPFLHGSPAHITTNASALIVLLFILFLNRKYRAEETLLLIWFGSGLGTWLIGRTSIHIGASGVIYGLIVYLIAASYWMKGWRPVIAAIIVFVLYAGAVAGLVPSDGKVSWEGHLAGAITGYFVARFQHR